MTTLNERLDTYDAGLLSGHGGGDVDWWHDYIRAELGRAHDFYQAQAADALDRLAAANARMRVALKSIGGFVAIRPRGDPGSYQRGFDIGFNRAGQAAAYIANQALEQS